jgi:FkbM family methyltransferase
MDATLQNGVLLAYRMVLRTGLLDTSWGYFAFERCYDLYKARLEAGSLAHVRPFVVEGSTAVDVGAHVGFFTERFARWVGAEGHVVAIEPEPINYGRLCRRLQRTRLAARVTPFNLAATEAAGSFRLRVDPDHPGDHQLAADGLAVAGETLDGILARGHWPPVSMVKLDIQGAEVRALAGAAETIERFRPTLLVEVDGLRLKRQGSSAAELFDSLAAKGYSPCQLTNRGVSRVLAVGDALRLAEATARYADFLFVQPRRAAAPV